MARIFFDGFETRDAELWEASAGYWINGFAAASTYGFPKGSYCLRLDYNENQHIHTTFPAKSSIYLALKLNFFLYAGAALSGFKFMAGANSMLAVGRDYTTGFLKAYSGSTNVGTGTRYLNGDTPYLIEVYYYIDDTNGRVVVKVNHEIDIDFTGDTKPGADTTVDRLWLGRENTSVTTHSEFYVDDVVLDDAGYPTNTYVQEIHPTGAGYYTQWDPSTGSNYQCVDEMPPSDTDFVATNVAAENDSYAMSNMTGTINSVKGLQAQIRSLLEGAATPTKVKILCRASGSDYFGSDETVPASVLVFKKLWETNPGGGAWDESGINAVELGCASVA